MKSQLLGQFEQLVMMSIVQWGRSAYGVTIHQGVESLWGGGKVSPGAACATLDRLEDKGLIASGLSTPTSERGGRARRCYPPKVDGERAQRAAALCGPRLCAARKAARGGAGGWRSL
jgi:PadR family transcriptional regulator, regulatory protein PadR